MAGKDKEREQDEDTEEREQDKGGADDSGDSDDKTEGKRTFTQAEIDAIIKERLERAKAKWQKDSDAAAEKARKEARERALEEQGEYKELAEARMKEADTLRAELKGAAERAKSLEAALKKYLDKERDGVPSAVLAILDKLDIVEQLDWLAEHKGEINGGDSGGDKKRGVPPTPKASGGKLADDEIERRRKEYRERMGGRRRF